MMYNISQLAHQNIKRRRKRPPLPPGGPQGMGRGRPFPSPPGEVVHKGPPGTRPGPGVAQQQVLARQQQMLPPARVANQLQQQLAGNLESHATKGQVSPRGQGTAPGKAKVPFPKPLLPPGGVVKPTGLPPNLPPGPHKPPGGGFNSMMKKKRLKPLPSQQSSLLVIAEDNPSPSSSSSVEKEKPQRLKKHGLTLTIEDSDAEPLKSSKNLTIDIDDDDDESVSSSTGQKPRMGKSWLSIEVDSDEDEDDGGGDTKSVYSFKSGRSRTIRIVDNDDDNEEIKFGGDEDGIENDVISVGNFEVDKFGLHDEHTASSNIKDDLIILSALGQGAGGIVYKALHKPTLRVVAVKQIPVYDPKKRAQMLKELKALYMNRAPIDMSTRSIGGLRSSNDEDEYCPFIVGFHDAYINPEQCNVAIVVEYMDGGSLQDIMEMGGCPNESLLAQISYRILKGFQVIHNKHQIHRDIKPANLLINHRGEVKISDFGIVRELESTQAMASTFVGTLTYMSPERISGHSYNANSDIWSFGLSIMSLALGTYPLTTSGGYWALLSSLNEDPVPKLPEDRFSPVIIDFIDRCLQKDPKLRPHTEELLQHPFITNVKDIVDKQLELGENVTPSNQEDNLTELDEILHAFCEKAYTSDESKIMEKLVVSSDRLCSLAKQYGISPLIVEDTFQRHNEQQYKALLEKCDHQQS